MIILLSFVFDNIFSFVRNIIITNCTLCNFYNDLLRMCDGVLKLSRRMQHDRMRWIFLFRTDRKVWSSMECINKTLKHTHTHARTHAHVYNDHGPLLKIPSENLKDSELDP